MTSYRSLSWSFLRKKLEQSYTTCCGMKHLMVWDTELSPLLQTMSLVLELTCIPQQRSSWLLFLISCMVLKMICFHMFSAQTWLSVSFPFPCFILYCISCIYCFDIPCNICLACSNCGAALTVSEKASSNGWAIQRILIRWGIILSSRS